MKEYSFWIINGVSCEGNVRWHIGRFDINASEYEVLEIAKQNAIGGCGDDYAEVTSVEWGYDDGTWTDYTNSSLY